MKSPFQLKDRQVVSNFHYNNLISAVLTCHVCGNHRVGHVEDGRIGVNDGASGGRGWATLHLDSIGSHNDGGRDLAGRNLRAGYGGR